MINEEGLRDWFGKSKSKDGKPGWVQSDGSPCANEPGETGTPKCYSSAKKASMSKKELRSADSRKSRQDPGQQQKSGAAKPTYVSTDKPKKKMKEETFNEAEDKKGSGSGTKDACYSKVKSRYSVWPSAYASGALVKCRKVGAANWGKSTKKEGMEEFYNLPELTEMQIGALKYAGYEVEVINEDEKTELQKKASRGDRFAMAKLKELRASGKIGKESKATWGPGAKKDIPNMKKIMGIGEEVTGGILVQDAQDFTPREIESIDIIKPEPIKGGQLHELERTKIQTGNMYQVIFGWRGKMMMVKLFFPDTAIPSRQKVAAALDKMYPGAQLRSYSHSVVDYDDPYINVGESTLHEKKEEERYCKLCEKKETRSKCAYGPKMWDKFTISNLSDRVKKSAAADSGITSESCDATEYNKDVKSRMISDKNRRRSLQRSKHKSSRINQKENLPVNNKEG